MKLWRWQKSRLNQFYRKIYLRKNWKYNRQKWRIWIWKYNQKINTKVNKFDNFTEGNIKNRIQREKVKHDSKVVMSYEFKFMSYRV